MTTLESRETLSTGWPEAHDLQHAGNRWQCPITGVVVPKSLRGNARARKHLIEHARDDPGVQAGLREKCAESFLLWCNLFAWTYVVRRYGPDGRQLPGRDVRANVPFITWPVQDRATTEIIHCIESGENAIISKSRDMGASWLLLTIAAWYWLFHKDSHVLFVSRVEDDVDASGDPDTLFWKLDHLLSRVPPWMLPCPLNMLERGPGKHRRHLHFHNPRLNCSIDGRAMTEHVGRGGRRKFVVFDEMAAQEQAEAAWVAASDTTNCKIGNSTPIGPGTMFSQLHQQGLTTGTPRIITLGYWDHPDKGIGREQAVDEDGAITGIAGRKFWRCPWFDLQAAERTRDDLGQNVLIDHTTSGNLFFNSTVVTNHLRDNAREPVRCEVENGRLVETSSGRWFVYADIEDDGCVKRTQYYSAFCDLSHGSGSSNSVCCVVDEDGRDVAVFADPNTSTYDFADEVCEAGKTVFSGASGQMFLGYESNGPGEGWHRDLARNGYHMVYFKRTEGKKGNKRTKEWGWRSSRREKLHLLRALGRGVEKGGETIHDRHTLNEMLEYVYMDDGSVGPGTMRDETTGARESHGDRVIARAGAVFMRMEMPKFVEKKRFRPGSVGDILGYDELIDPT